MADTDELRFEQRVGCRKDGKWQADARLLVGAWRESVLVTLEEEVPGRKRFQIEAVMSPGEARMLARCLMASADSIEARLKDPEMVRRGNEMLEALKSK